MHTIGVDESGKGDFFGPLVVAAAAVEPDNLPPLQLLNVRDSKKVTDARAAALAAQIKKIIPHNIVVVMPEKYNELYAKIGNLNKLLAWAHARAIENLLGEVDAVRIISDQFAKNHVLESALMAKARIVSVEQKVRGESEMSVAAASIIARAEFLRALEQLSRTWGMTFPKGGGSPVDIAGSRFLKTNDQASLSKVAKLHFKNSKKIRDLVAKSG
jgi:ribonuclease HIII